MTRAEELLSKFQNDYKKLKKYLEDYETLERELITYKVYKFYDGSMLAMKDDASKVEVL